MGFVLPDCLKSATVHETGEGTAVLTFQDPELLLLTNAVVEYIQNNNNLIYDQASTDQRGRACTRSRGEGFFVQKDSSVGSYKNRQDSHDRH
jgi:hypothetical protein